VKYKVHIFYKEWKQKELGKHFDSSDEALRYAIAERIKLDKVFSIIIYKTKKYFNNFQCSKGLSILEFFKNIKWTYFCIEDKPPVALSLDEMNKDEIGLYLPQYEGYELSGPQIILFYSGDLDKNSTFVLTLHECGHAWVDATTKLKYEHFTLFHELKAWIWAKKQCDNLGIDEMLFRQLARECLSTYVYGEIDKKGKLKGCGMPQKTFWKKYTELTKINPSDYSVQ